MLSAQEVCDAISADVAGDALGLSVTEEVDVDAVEALLVAVGSAVGS